MDLCWIPGCNFIGTIHWSTGGLKILKELDLSENILNAKLPTSGETKKITILSHIREVNFLKKEGKRPLPIYFLILE